MFIKSITLNNFGPFKGPNTANFNPDSSVVFIKGIYTDNDVQSNRAGKSTFVEAILYLLFGKARDKEINLIHNGEKEMSVSGTIIIDNEEINITRGRNIENKPLLTIEGIKCTKKTDKQKELEALIGLSYDDFVNTYFCPQNQMHGFMKSTPAEKKKQLQSWFNMDKWTVWHEKAKSRHAILKAELEKLQITKANHQVNLNSKVIVSDEPIINAIIDLKKKELEDCNAKQLKLTLELNNTVNPEELTQTVNSLYAEINQYKNNISSAEVKLRGLQSAKELATSKRAQLDQLQANVPSIDGIRNALSSQQIQLTILCSQLGNLTSKFNETKTKHASVSCFDGVCPVDKNQCDKGTRVPDYAQKLHAELVQIAEQAQSINSNKTALEADVQRLQGELSIANYTQNAINELSKTPAPESYDDMMKQLLENINMFSEKQATVSKAFDEFSAKLKMYDQNHRMSLKNQIDVCTQQIKTINNVVSAEYNNLGAVRQIKADRAKLEALIAETDVAITNWKKDMYRWGYIVSLLGKDGIPSLLIENKLSEIEEFTNILLESVSNGFKVEFQTTREVSTKETHCSVCGALFGTENKCTSCSYGFKKNKVKDEIDLKIFNGSYERSFELDSGGGQVLISLALRLSLSNLLSKRKKKCELLILDEVFGALDPVNRNIVANMIFNILKNLMGFRQIFIISHSDLNDYPFQTIRIIRDAGKNYSKISLEN